MPRYFTHLYNSEILCDHAGQECAGVAAAREAALRTAGELIAEHIVEGSIVNLSHRLEVVDEAGQVVVVIKFADLFEGGDATMPEN